MKRFFIVSSALCLVLLLFAGYVLFFPNGGDDPKGTMVTVSRGASFRTIADSLLATGVVRNSWSFQIAGRLLGYTTSIKTGKYLFIPGQSNFSILHDIGLGKSRIITHVTIPEGWRLERIANRFERELGIDERAFLQLCRNEQFIRQNGINANSLEGFLLPETYAFYWQTEEHEILTRILSGFKQFYHDSLIRRQEELQRTQVEILTLASIIEAESSLDDERPTISGVYWNRLKKNMRLEADPTIQYALGEGRRLRFQDLDVESPYNTYRRTGLPPGPINNPGRRSILAALYPEDHAYLFFVATGTGGHRFAKSYGDHQKNIRLYHRMRRELRRIAAQKG